MRSPVHRAMKTVILTFKPVKKSQVFLSSRPVDRPNRQLRVAPKSPASLAKVTSQTQVVTFRVLRWLGTMPPLIPIFYQLQRSHSVSEQRVSFSHWMKLWSRGLNCFNLSQTFTFTKPLTQTWFFTPSHLWRMGHLILTVPSPHGSRKPNNSSLLPRKVSVTSKNLMLRVNLQKERLIHPSKSSI